MGDIWILEVMKRKLIIQGIIRMGSILVLKRNILDLGSFCLIMKSFLKKEKRKETDLLDFDMKWIPYIAKNTNLIVILHVVLVLFVLTQKTNALKHTNDLSQTFILEWGFYCFWLLSFHFWSNWSIRWPCLKSKVFLFASYVVSVFSGHVAWLFSAFKPLLKQTREEKMLLNLL